MASRKEGRAEPLKAGVQRILFSIERFGEHEMANHAAAGAYAFLLSATPAVLLVLALARSLLRPFPRAVSSIEAIVSEFLGPLASAKAVASFFSGGLGGLALAVGAVSLVWAARLFIVTIQRALRLINAASGRNRPVKENLLTFAVELLCLVAVVAVLAVAQAARLLLERPGSGLSPALADLAGAALGAAPSLALLLFVYLTYRLIPAERPRRSSAAAAAAACLILYAAFSAAMGLAVNGARYELLYGVFSALIVLLVRVYTFFTLYFLCAEYTYVADHFDALLFGRFCRVSRAAKAGRLERALFMAPERLLGSYAQALPAGGLVFRAGEAGREVYFVYEGEVGIYAAGEGRERRVGTIGPGEVFGEMADVLDEPRTATARAEADSVLLKLPPEVFALFLRSDAEASRRLIDSLAARLKGANARIAEREREEAGHGKEPPKPRRGRRRG